MQEGRFGGAHSSSSLIPPRTLAPFIVQTFHSGQAFEAIVRGHQLDAAVPGGRTHKGIGEGEAVIQRTIGRCQGDGRGQRDHLGLRVQGNDFPGEGLASLPLDPLVELELDTGGRPPPGSRWTADPARNGSPRARPLAIRSSRRRQPVPPSAPLCAASAIGAQ